MPVGLLQVALKLDRPQQFPNLKTSLDLIIVSKKFYSCLSVGGHVFAYIDNCITGKMYIYTDMRSKALHQSIEAYHVLPRGLHHNSTQDL